MFIVACRRRVNGNLSDSTEMVINRRVEVSVGVTRDGLCDLTGRGMTFAILTMQEVEKDDQRNVAATSRQQVPWTRKEKVAKE